jgi:two-component system, cell cycle response regulator CpdR
MSTPTVHTHGERRRPQSAEAFRRLADAFGRISDFSEFVSYVESALNRAGVFEKAQIDLRIGEIGSHAPVPFSASELTVPLMHSGRTAGVMRVAGKRGLRPFNAEDLHLMSSLSSFIASLVGHAIHHGDLVRNMEVLRKLLDSAPVAVVGLDGKGSPIVASRRARAWLCNDEAAALEAVVEALGELKDPGRPHGRAHIRRHGRLLVAETAALVAGDEGPVARSVVIHDLTPEQARLMDGFKRELYRCRLEERRLTFMLIESASDSDALFRHMHDIAANLGPDDSIGPYDGSRIGAVLSGSGEREAIGLLRLMRPILEMSDARIGLAAMGAMMHETEPMLQAALSSMTPLAEIVRPRLLVHDDYPAVADMLEMILRSRYRVVKSTSLPATMGLLGSAPFDGFLTELDLKESVQGLELARRAVEMQPGLQTIFTASAARIRKPEDDPLIRRSPLLPKPFNVREVLAAVQAAVPAG